MGRPVACECAHGGCSALQVDDQQTPGVFFDIQLLFEGKRLRNTNTQLWACCAEHKDAALKFIRKDLCKDEMKGVEESED